ncbi:protein PHYLLO, chloroplastic isoform X3 [Syzygium oleosum]|uniref:protein PHYLLO, chloroplastic isoform X3 n=1 Tax=Syzygium oleosum TaxID=219896 RepID=UPI0024BA3AC1|nr:protein PHYLLO, chloroplastic isoform X3 [Syzygium oleosum]
MGPPPTLSQAAAFPPRTLTLRYLSVPSLSLPHSLSNSLPLLCTASFGSHRPTLHIHQMQNAEVAKAVRFDGPIIDVDALSAIKDCELVVENCITRTLPPALTLERGLQSIKEAVEELKLDPPPSPSGVFRFSVMVPPGAKALYWFCVQPESSKVFPLFFMSKEEEPTYKTLYLNETRGAFGIGAAAYFRCSSSGPTGESTQIKRYLLNDSALIKAYGFLDVNFNSELSSMEHEAGSFYFFIPQIELDECEDVSILSATLAWSGPSSCPFEEALVSFESSSHQVISYIQNTGEKFPVARIQSTLGKLDVAENTLILMAHRVVTSPDAINVLSDPMDLVFPSLWKRLHLPLNLLSGFHRRLLYRLSQATERSYSVRDLTNINAVWASLIIEECFRLGLTYFCIAPGSRSSPLAIAAASHPLATCIACFDERSLAFHAIGYARGSRRPAVVITTSGTAVSNLLPAVVEASQDFMPLLLLTADRPPELQDVGANQSMDQVNHFGSFVRYFFSLPVPSDHIPARMVLTTLDSAVHWATSAPGGPVHLNCPFREPLDGRPEMWMRSCLNGLDFWMANTEPFTKYIQVQHYHSNTDATRQMEEILKSIQASDRGLLLLGAIHSEDDIWAVLLLAKHLCWPVVADILSGLRLRRLSSAENILFLDHLDHALISNSFQNWMQVDVVIQIGSKITSKRVAQMLENSPPRLYIMVDEHPCRHDPSHMMTHRIQSSIIGFVDVLLRGHFLYKSSTWSDYLQALNNMVARELSFQIDAEHSLTEPQVACVISKTLSPAKALFVGNSMVIRDMDMYGQSRTNFTDNVTSMLLNSRLQYQLIRIAGNRGASGIDGLLSTAVGFALGSNKQVVCLIGDVSFLHDTNGLAILSQRTSRKPMTIIAINNHGGAIFSLLPIANNTDPQVLDKYFYTSHNISIRELCLAHGVKHVLVHTKKEFQDALNKSDNERMDCVIEVQSYIEANAVTHSSLRTFASQAANDALRILMKVSAPGSVTLSPQFLVCEILRVEFSMYRIPLVAPPTSADPDCDCATLYREGFLLHLYLEDGIVGLGEIAPLEIHEENLQDVEEQLRFLIHVMKGAKINYMLPTLKGSFSSWIKSELGIMPCSIFPSVRCGLEMAILNAIAGKQDSNLSSVLSCHTNRDVVSEKSQGVKICALLDPHGTPEEVAQVASMLVQEGFTAIKLKVARQADPIQDAIIIQEVRKKVGYKIQLRADANRKWTYEEAIRFSSSVKNCDLQYIEEPVQDEHDIIKFCEESGLSVALDETIDNCGHNPLKMLADYVHPGIIAVVLKPSVLGGFETSATVAWWAQHLEKMAVVSSTFESGVGLSAHILFSHYIDLHQAQLFKTRNHKVDPPIAHGLGTYQWLKDDVTTDPLKISHHPNSECVEANIADASRLLQNFQVNDKVIVRKSTDEEVRRYNLMVNLKGESYSINAIEVGQETDNVLVFLHGFLGTCEEWIPIMKAISGSARCISINLPGHGNSVGQSHATEEAAEKPRLPIEKIADVLCNSLGQITSKKIILIGYSMGARISLYMTLKFTNKIKGAAIISGSPGLKNASARKVRRAKDDNRAQILVTYGLPVFLDSWYEGELWKSLRSHPHFQKIVSSRLQHSDVHGLAKALSDLSIGRQPSLWEDLKHCETPLLLVVGESDAKFKAIARKMFDEIGHNREVRDGSPDSSCKIVEVPGSGHAAHLENPLAVARALRKFLTRVNKEFID